MDTLKLVFGLKDRQFILLLQKDSGAKNVNSLCFQSIYCSPKIDPPDKFADTYARLQLDFELVLSCPAGITVLHHSLECSHKRSKKLKKKGGWDRCLWKSKFGAVGRKIKPEWKRI